MRVVSHVEQTQASVCFQRSEGRFGCISCHDPHFSPAPAEKEAFYREKCLVCHADRGCSVPLVDRTKLSAADSCANCHLPSRGLNTVPHTSQTDHRVLRNPRIVSETSKDIPLVLFQTGDRSLPELEQDRAWGLVLAKDAERKQDVKLAREAEQKLSRVQLQLTDDMQVLEWLGVAEQLLELNAQPPRDLLRITMLSTTIQGMWSTAM